MLARLPSANDPLPLDLDTPLVSVASPPRSLVSSPVPSPSVRLGSSIAPAFEQGLFANNNPSSGPPAPYLGSSTPHPSSFTTTNQKQGGAFKPSHVRLPSNSFVKSLTTSGVDNSNTTTSYRSNTTGTTSSPLVSSASLLVENASRSSFQGQERNQEPSHRLDFLSSQDEVLRHSQHQLFSHENPINGHRHNHHHNQHNHHSNSSHLPHPLNWDFQAAEERAKAPEPAGITAAKHFWEAEKTASIPSWTPSWVPRSIALRLVFLDHESGWILITFLSWLCAGIMSNMMGKAALNDLKLPMFMTTIQVAATALGTFLWLRLTGVRPIKPMSASLMPKIALSAAGYLWANLSGHISLGQIPVSFMHTIKASAPLFAVGLAVTFQKAVFPRAVYMSLIPIICGVALATVTEANFDMMGFLTAVLSTVGLCLMQMYSKGLLERRVFDHYNLLMYTSSAALLPLIVLAASVEGPALFTVLASPPGGLTAEPSLAEHGASNMWRMGKMGIAGFLYYAQTMLAFSLLSQVTPVSYAIASTTKRLILITASILYFGNDVSFANITGIAIAVCGVALYQKAKLDAKAASARKNPATIV